MEKNQSKYPSESAGRKMISNIPIALPEEKILDIRKRLFERAQEFETLNYIYINLNKIRLLAQDLSPQSSPIFAL